jgi:PAS domain S-box-containing protein
VENRDDGIAKRRKIILKHEAELARGGAVEAEWETVEGSRAFSSPGFSSTMPIPFAPSDQPSDATESRWEQLFEQSPLSLQIFAPDGRTIRFNPAWKKLFGLSDEEAYAFNVLESRDLIESGAVHLIRKAFEGEVVFVPPVPFPVRGNPQTIRWIGGTVFPVITPDGVLREVVVIHHDITELKEAEETMRRLNEILEERVASRTSELRASEESLRAALDAERQLNDLKTAFAGMVSHEFRTPLGIISAATEILERYHDRLDAAQRVRHTSAILDAVRRMTAMMEHILLLAGIDGGKAAAPPVEIDLAAWLRQTLSEIKSTCPSRDLCPKQCPAGDGGTACFVEHDIHLDIDPAEALHRVRVDASLLQHILGNLFSNACKYSPPGKPVGITLRHAPPHFTLAVRDHGIGIPAEEQSRLFDGFFRGSNVGNRPGTGLGLAITRRCVERLGGRIELDSRPGCGSTFTVTLPLAPA